MQGQAPSGSFPIRDNGDDFEKGEVDWGAAGEDAEAGLAVDFRLVAAADDVVAGEDERGGEADAAAGGRVSGYSNRADGGHGLIIA